MSAEVYCRDKAAPPGSTFYYGSLFYGPEKKRRLNCLYAFLTEIEDVILECSDPGVARIKLAWWQEEIERTCAGEARHPVARELGKLILDGSLDHEQLRDFIETTGQQPGHGQFDHYDDILGFYSRGSGLIWEAIARQCGARQQQSIASAKKTGCLLRYFDNLQSARPLIHNQQFIAPGEELRHFNLEIADLLQSRQDNVRVFFAQQIDRLITDLHKNSRSMATSDRRGMLLFIILSQITVKTCEEIRQSGYQLTRERTSLTPLRKLWLAWLARITN